MWDCFILKSKQLAWQTQYVQYTFKEKRQTFAFSTPFDYFKIKLRKVDFLKRC